jgi:hypothetical protein
VINVKECSLFSIFHPSHFLLLGNTKNFVRRGRPKRIERMEGLLSFLVYCMLACNLPPMCSVVIYIALGLL